MSEHPSRDPEPELLVLERTPFWLPELERQITERRIAAWPLEDGRPQPLDSLSPAPLARLLVATAELLFDALTWLPQWTRAAQPRGTLAILRRSDSHWEWPLRDLGVTSVLDEFAGGRRVAAACERLLVRGFRSDEAGRASCLPRDRE